MHSLQTRVMEMYLSVKSKFNFIGNDFNCTFNIFHHASMFLIDVWNCSVVIFLIDIKKITSMKHLVFLVD